MNFKMALAAVALTLMGTSAAQAQLSIVLDDPVQNATSPSFIVFNGTIFNIGNTAIEIQADSLAVPSGIGQDLPHSDLIIGTWPLTLGPNDSFRGDWLFGLDIPASQTTSFGGTYAVSTDADLDGDGAPDFFAADFRVNITVAAVPEPGAMALLLSGLVGGSLVVIRRRK